MNIALPAIQHAFSLSRTDLQWVVTSFALPFGGFMLVGGRAADLYGPRRVFLAGIVAFIVSSLTASVSVSGLMLVIARASEGLSGAAMEPAALALLVTSFRQGVDRNRALAINGSMLSAGFVSGLLVGGALTTLVSWRAVFLVNLPIGCLMAVFASRSAVEEGPRAEERSLDVAGAVSATVAALAFMYAVAAFGDEGHATQGVAVGLCTCAVLIGCFLIIEVRASAPLVPGRLAGDRSVVAGSVAALLVSASVVGMIFLLTLYLQQGLGYTPINTAFILAGLGVAAMVSGAQAARIVARWGARRVLLTALAVQAGGAVDLARVTSHGSLALVVPGTVLTGCGFVLALVASTIVVTGSVADVDQGAASGFLNAAIELGAGLGVATLVAVATVTSGHLASGSRTPGHAAQIANGTRHGMAAAALLVLCAAVASLFIRRDQGQPAGSTGSKRHQAALGETRDAGDTVRVEGNLRLPDSS